MYGISQDHLYGDQYRSLKGPFKPQEHLSKKQQNFIVNLHLDESQVVDNDLTLNNVHETGFLCRKTYRWMIF